jgi:hypothetical protein
MERLLRWLAVPKRREWSHANSQHCRRLLHQSGISNSKLSGVYYACWGSPMHFSRMKRRTFVRSATATVLKRAQLALLLCGIVGIASKLLVSAGTMASTNATGSNSDEPSRGQTLKKAPLGMVWIPGGTFLMGTNDKESSVCRARARGNRNVPVAGYRASDGSRATRDYGARRPNGHSDKRNERANDRGRPTKRTPASRRGDPGRDRERSASLVSMLPRWCILRVFPSKA